MRFIQRPKMHPILSWNETTFRKFLNTEAMYSFQNTHSEKLFDPVGFSFHALPSSFLSTALYSHVLVNISNSPVSLHFCKLWVQSLITNILFTAQWYLFTENHVWAPILSFHSLKSKHLRKWDVTYYFSLHSYFQRRKKKKEVNPLLFTVSITQSDRQGNETENQGGIKFPPKPQETVYT